MSLIRMLWRCAFSPRLFNIYEVTSIGLVDVSTTYLFSIFPRNLHKLRLQYVCVYSLQKSYEARNLERLGDHIVISVSVPRDKTEVVTVNWTLIALWERKDLPNTNERNLSLYLSDLITSSVLL